MTAQIKLKHSGGNGVIIEAPASNPASDRTLTLPSDADGTIVSKDTSNNVEGIASINGGQLSNRNLAINGADMQVAQRGTSTTGLQNAGGIFTVDRFAHRRYGTWSNAVFKHERVNSGTGLFKKALKVTTTTAEGSAASGDKTVMIGHYIEAQDTIAALGDGTAEAKSFTVSFYVKASIATTYSLHLSTAHLITDKAYGAPFTVNSANTWERKTITFPAITNSIGTVNGADTASGLRLHWVLDAATGSNSANTYINYVSGDFKYPTGQSPSGFANTLNATFELSGVQIEAGSVATDLEHKSYAQDLALCQRYYQVLATGDQAAIGNGFAFQTNRFQCNCPLPVEMRAVPSLDEQMTGATKYRINMGNSDQNTGISPSLSSLVSSTRIVNLGWSSLASNVTNGDGGQIRKQSDSGILGVSAEL